MTLTINIQITRRDDTPNGIWNGRVTFHAEETGPYDGNGSIFRGAVLGRGYSEADALRDFARRANLADSSLHLLTSNLTVTNRRDIATNKALTPEQKAELLSSFTGYKVSK